MERWFISCAEMSENGGVNFFDDIVHPRELNQYEVGLPAEFQPDLIREMIETYRNKMSCTLEVPPEKIAIISLNRI